MESKLYGQTIPEMHSITCIFAFTLYSELKLALYGNKVSVLFIPSSAGFYGAILWLKQLASYHNGLMTKRIFRVRAEV